MVLQQMVIDVTRGRYPVVVDHLVFELLQMRDSNFEQPPNAADIARCAFGFGDDGAPLPGGFRVHPDLAAAGLYHAAVGLDKLKDATGAAAVRRELASRYVGTYFELKQRGEAKH